MTLVARLKATLSDVEPQVLRRFDVPLKIKLNRLHDVIQAAMGWTDSHLYEFRAGGVGWGVPDPDGYYDGPLPASKSSLLDVLEDTRLELQFRGIARFGTGRTCLDEKRQQDNCDAAQDRGMRHTHIDSSGPAPAPARVETGNMSPEAHSLTYFPVRQPWEMYLLTASRRS